MNTFSAILASADVAMETAKDWPGGRGSFVVVGSFDSATIQLEILGPDDTTWLPVSTETALTADGIVNFEVCPGLIRASASAGSPVVTAKVARVPI